MKLTSILTIAAVTSAVSAGTPCGLNKHPFILAAIGKFCTNQGITVPSEYARKGASGGKDAYISITGTCKPAQWVPKQYCLSQFQTMCSNSRKTRKFGRNGCQTWNIHYQPPPPRKPAPKAKPAPPKPTPKPAPPPPKPKGDGRISITRNL